jgi:hypothetical protein
MTVLTQNLARHPHDRDTLVALIGFYRDAGNFADALRYAEQLAVYVVRTFRTVGLAI